MMKRVLLMGVALAALAACQPAVPDSGAGVGFDTVGNQRAARDAALEGGTVPQVPAVQTSPLDTAGTASGADTRALAEAAALNSGVAPVSASPSNPAPQVVSTPDGISQENDFDAVSDQRSIQADAALRQQNIANYQVVQPTALPSRDGESGPNIVAYALETTHAIGTEMHRRSRFASEARHINACRGFASADLAQEAFLAGGGPRRDRLNLDPDGDGYACNWNPAPFRLARSGN